MEPKYQRVLLKLSGEALAGDKRFGLDYDVIRPICQAIKTCVEMGAQIAIVVGGGNFWRGRQGKNMDKSTADYMGMLATTLNALALCDAIESKGVSARVQTAININVVAEPFILRKALKHLEKGRVVIFACGTGNPYFTTDTGAALRAAQIKADALLMAKNIDGVYDSDPRKNPDATKLEHIAYMDVMNQKLSVMDFTSITMCMENNLPIVAFGLDEENSIVRAAMGEKIGTVID